MNGKAVYQLRPLLLQDIGQAIRLSNAERWNQTEKDWELLIGNPQNICLAATEGEKVIGTATAINYANEVAWIGMVLVDIEYRGKGVSKLLLSGLFERLKSCKSLKLDATPAGQPVYEKFGFKNEYLIHRMTAASVSLKSLSADGEYSPLPVHPVDIPQIIEFDQRVFGANRKQLIEFLVKNNPGNSWMLKNNGQITGFVLGREGTRFQQIGPVMATNTADAKKLIAKSLVAFEGQAVVADILDDKKDLIQWLTNLGFIVQRPFIRMYQYENPYPGIPENQFLIGGPEFG